jgi:hypothetical protein
VQLKHKRGAPPGNQNAFKHGFYSARFKEGELRVISHTDASELADEIALIRVATARLLASLDSHTEARDLQAELSILRGFNLSAHSIRALVRTRLMLARDGWTLPPGLQRSDDSDLAAPDAGKPLTGTAPGA